MTANTPKLSDVVKKVVDARLDDFWSALPGKIVEFDKKTQRASVQPMTLRSFRDETDTRQTERLPVINEVPVMLLSIGPFRAIVPVPVGSFVLLVFCDYNIEQFLATGSELDSGDERTHSINDAVAIVGLRPFTAPIKDFPDDRMSIGQDGVCTIEIDTEIRLGSNNASDPVGLKSDLTRLKSAIVSAIPLTGDGGLQFKNQLLASLNIAPTFPESSTKVKAE